LSLVSNALVGFLQSFKPSRTNLGKLFICPLTNLLET
jgi:hypothetical protein